MADEGTTLMLNAVKLDEEGKCVQAEECYTKAIHILSARVKDQNTPLAERAKLMSYLEKVAARVKELRQAIAASSTLPAPTPTQRTPAQSNAAKATVPPKTTAAATSKPASAKPKVVAPPLATNSEKKDGPSSPALSAQASNTPTNLFNQFPSRSSDFVLRAVEVATELSHKGEVKRAIDVLQHAYALGSQERNNPSNFGNIADALELLRRQYYKNNPPRFLQDNELLSQDIELLRFSGMTNTILLPMWDDLSEGYGAENVFMPCEGLWVDRFTPKLCPAQQRHEAIFARLTEMSGANNTSQHYILGKGDPANITQSVVGDCSLACSLIICASYQQRFPFTKLISNVIYPQDAEGRPIVSQKGKYCIKMLINGMTRLVLVDDRLPMSPAKDKLLCMYSKDPQEMWVSLMEKAFVKVCGGTYDFPGSSSSSDLFKLSGWLPDTVSMDSPSFDEEYHWKRLSFSYPLGAVIGTITTPVKMAALVESQQGLVSGHAYAILDVQEVEIPASSGKSSRLRVLLIRNPWSTSSWRGSLSIEDASPAAKAVHAAMGLTAASAAGGNFCVTWEDACTYFDRLNLSWNPYLLFRRPDAPQPRRPTRLAAHGVFDYATSMGQSPQIHIGVVGSSTRTRMHLTLSRHITDVSEFGLQFEKNHPKVPFVALKVYNVTSCPSITQHTGVRCMADRCTCRRLASYTDLRQRLCPLNEVTFRNSAANTFSFDCPSGHVDLVVVLARLGSTVQESFGYTVTLHTDLPQFKLPLQRPESAALGSTFYAQAAGLASSLPSSTVGVFMHNIPPTRLPHTSVVRGAWVKGQSCGGRTGEPTFIYNPQYLLHLAQPARVHVRLSVEGTESCCQLQLVRISSSERTSEDASVLTAFAPRVGSVQREGNLTLQALAYGHGGAAVGSDLPHTLVVDNLKSLGELPPVISFTIRVGVRPLSPSSKSFTMYDVDQLEDDVRMVLLAAIAKGHCLSEASTRLQLTNQGGGTVEWGEPLASLYPNSASNASGAAEVNLVPISDPPELSTAAEAFAGELKDLADGILRGSAQRQTTLHQLASITRRVTLASHGMSTAAAAHLLSIISTIREVVRKALTSEGEKACSIGPVNVANTSTCLPPLPAGDYTIIPSLYDKGVPGTYTLCVESTEAHDLRELPAEDVGQKMTVTLHGRLLPAGGALRSGLAPPLVLRKTDEVFSNAKVVVSLKGSSSGVFFCRLFVMEEGDQRSVYANVALFKEKDGTTMELIRSSGMYTSSGVALRGTELKGNATKYVLVISASERSSARFLLKCSCSVDCVAEMVA